jgi:cell division septum initiation protein DivIVA
VALERQSIEKKDFPIGRRGYDPDAVDTHLSGLAEEIEELKRTSRRRTETLASSASEQVRAIVEAAESSAAEIQRQAEEEAADIRAEATGEAQSTREQASEQARDYVGRVSESTAVMLQRLDAMESELGALIESLRTGSNRLNADLQLLEGNLTEVSEAAAPRPRFEREPESGADFAAADEPFAEPEVAESEAAEAAEAEGAEGAEAEAPDGYDEGEAVVEVDEVDVIEVEEGAADEQEPSAAGDDGSDDTEGARLIALNMALNGTPREETDRYLAENFKLGNREGLLDEVYASVEG